jgi:DNA-binding SARP family transcriptional activator
LLGPPAAWNAAGEPVALSRKALALLGFLALEPRDHARGTLAARFWADSEESTARAALRNALSELRPALGDALEADRNVVRIEPRTIALDTAALADALKRNDAAALEACARTPPGELLEGLDLGDAPEHDDWLLVVRETWRQRVEAMWSALADARPNTAGPPASAADAPAARIALPSPGPLAVPPTVLFGRDEDVAAALRVLDDGATRLLTLTGPGGVG